MTLKTRILTAAAALALTACGGATQPKPGCTIGQGEFAAKYTLKAGETTSGSCAALKGELINLRDYSNQQGTNFVAIRSANLGAHRGSCVDPTAANYPCSIGEFPTESNNQNFCVMPTLTPARVQLPASGSAPAVDKTYEWSDVQVLVTSRAAGTQIKANLKYTDAVSGCTANYDVVAMWPGINCATTVNGVKTADNTKCATKADPAKGIKIGCSAGGFCLSPDIKTYCDPEIFLCVLDGTPPVLNDE
ncbi:MAG TPA: hypothetical protein VK447_21010 [Myxococcaceae bacterium]|nr:hypothetical protein [Myxococcaceae bacterium]